MYSVQSSDVHPVLEHDEANATPSHSRNNAMQFLATLKHAVTMTGKKLAKPE